MIRDGFNTNDCLRCSAGCVCRGEIENDELVHAGLLKVIIDCMILHLRQLETQQRAEQRKESQCLAKDA